MSAAIALRARGSTPAARAARLVIALAAAQHHQEELCKETVDRANRILADVLRAAMAGGFHRHPDQPPEGRAAAEKVMVDLFGYLGVKPTLQLVSASTTPTTTKGN